MIKNIFIAVFAVAILGCGNRSPSVKKEGEFVRFNIYYDVTNEDVKVLQASGGLMTTVYTSTQGITDWNRLNKSLPEVVSKSVKMTVDGVRYEGKEIYYGEGALDLNPSSRVVRILGAVNSRNNIKIILENKFPVTLLKYDKNSCELQVIQRNGHRKSLPFEVSPGRHIILIEPECEGVGRQRE